MDGKLQRQVPSKSALKKQQVPFIHVDKTTAENKQTNKQMGGQNNNNNQAKEFEDACVAREEHRVDEASAVHRHQHVRCAGNAYLLVEVKGRHIDYIHSQRGASS